MASETSECIRRPLRSEGGFLFRDDHHGRERLTEVVGHPITLRQDRPVEQ
jgi:hypothetical protein